MKKEDIDAIVIHCSATKEGKDIKAADIEKEHKKRGFKRIGYNYVIDLDGTVEVGRPLTMDGAHCNTAGLSGRSYNKHSILAVLTRTGNQRTRARRNSALLSMILCGTCSSFTTSRKSSGIVTHPLISTETARSNPVSTSRLVLALT